MGAAWRALLVVVAAACPAVAAEVAPSDAAYDVAPDCPARSTWRERVAARLPAEPTARAALERLPVHIQRAGEGRYSGWVGADGSDERRVRGRECGEVFDALVLIAALSLEATVDPAPALGATPAAVDSLATVALDEPPGAPVPADRGAGLDAAKPQVANVHLGALGFAQVQTGTAPSAALDVGAALVASWRARHLDPWLLLGAYTGVGPQVMHIGRATARFEHWSARALGCPWRFPRDGRAALRPCVGLDVGRSRGEGTGVAGASARSAPWLSGLAELRLELALPAGVSIGAAGGAVVPLVLPRFYFEPGVVAYQPAPIGFAASSFAALLF